MVRGKDRNLGGTGLARKEGGRKAASGQNQFGGGRYGIGEEAKKGTQRALSKAKATEVFINPDKPDAIGKTYN